MSKRFGRNQRRRAREQEAVLKLSRDRAIRMWRDASEEMLDLREIVDDIAARLPVMTSALPPKQHPGGQGSGPDGFPAAVSTDGEVRLVRMHKLLTSLDRIGVHDALHVRVQLADGELAYALSDGEIRLLADPAFQDLLSKEIARQLAARFAADLPSRF